MKRCGLLVAYGFLVAFGLVGCQESARQVIIEADKEQRQISTGGATVRDALTAAGVTLGPLDRVRPDLYVETTPGMLIVVTRVEERFETERVTVPFERKTVVNEALPAGETRLVQLGANGADEVTYRVVLENGVQVERTRVSYTQTKSPVDEIVAVGAQDSLQPVPIEGTVAYLAAGNAWIMRDSSAARRPLTAEGDLDGRVFDLSPGGRRLLYTRRLEGDIVTPLNELWVADTTIVGEAAISLPVRGVLYAEWSPDGSHIAYSTAERTTSPPGWRANNDLWIGSPDTVSDGWATRVISANTSGTYSWWGTTFKWTPDGRTLAYARPDQIGVIDVISRTTVELADFPAYNTYGEWAWTPGLSWSPDGHFLAGTIHGAPLEGEEAQDSPVFDLWVFARDGSVKVPVAEQVGMWGWPEWGEAGLLYGQALEPLHSVDSRYALILRDHDGSNPMRLFPTAGEPGVLAPPEVAWSPSGDAFILLYNGNLYLGDIEGGAPRQLTSNGQNTRPRWASNGRRDARYRQRTAGLVPQDHLLYNTQRDSL